MHSALIPPFKASNKTVGQTEAQVLHRPRTGTLQETGQGFAVAQTGPNRPLGRRSMDRQQWLNRLGHDATPK